MYIFPQSFSIVIIPDCPYSQHDKLPTYQQPGLLRLTKSRGQTDLFLFYTERLSWQQRRT
ncbi:hypothetical protein INR49_031052 [Caranx melampygus]|nr:hypothetical protein INR49_031052 [Caranx melampygus]